MIQNRFKIQIQINVNNKSFQKLKQKCSECAKNGIGNYSAANTFLEIA